MRIGSLGACTHFGHLRSIQGSACWQAFHPKAVDKGGLSTNEACKLCSAKVQDSKEVAVNMRLTWAIHPLEPEQVTKYMSEV